MDAKLGSGPRHYRNISLILGKLRDTWEDTGKLDLVEIYSKDMDWVTLTQDMKKFKDLHYYGPKRCLYFIFYETIQLILKSP